MQILGPVIQNGELDIGTEADGLQPYMYKGLRKSVLRSRPAARPRLGDEVLDGLADDDNVGRSPFSPLRALPILSFVPDLSCCPFSPLCVFPLCRVCLPHYLVCAFLTCAFRILSSAASPLSPLIRSYNIFSCFRA